MAAEAQKSFDVNKLSCEIFSILESEFLFSYDDRKTFVNGTPPGTPAKYGACFRKTSGGGKIRILSIDAGADLVAAVSLARLEASLVEQCRNPAARIADFFDVAAGSGSGGVLVAMLFTRGPDGRPLFSASDALRFIEENRRKFLSGVRKGIFRRSGGIFRRMFGDSTLRDAIKPVLVPCYDLSSGTPFVFSRADAVEADVFDFSIGGVCAATCADKKAVKVGSVAEGRAKIQAIGGGVAMRNPMAMAITHVMNNKTEFPFAAGVEDMLAISFGCSEAYGARSPKSASEHVKIAGDGAADMVDQAVAMAFKQRNREDNYVRIQGQSQESKRVPTAAAAAKIEEQEEFLRQRSVDSVMFRGRKRAEKTNGERLEMFTAELLAEERRRKSSPLPTVLIKPAVTPRTSSATNSTTFTTLSASSPC